MTTYDRQAEAKRLSAALAFELGQTPERVSATRWRFKAQTDKSEPWHYVDFLAGRLFCTCTGFGVRKTCRHLDWVKENEMNDDDYPMTRDLVPAATFGVAVHRSPMELRARLEEMKAERGLVATFMKDVMEESTPGTTDGDYGVIPGTDKPTLFKPGAEKLCELYGYAPTIKHKEELRDNESGHYRVVMTIALVQKGTGTVVAEGIGECNTREARYFYRWTPEWELNKFPDLLSLKDTFKKQTREWKDKKTGAKRSGTFYRVENDDLFTLWNTVLKMAKKRALVDAVLSATRSSGIFSQSADSLHDWIEAEYTDLTDAPEPAATPAPEHEATQESPVSASAGSGGPSPQAEAPAPSPACEHRDSYYNEKTTMLTCRTCGVVLEEPPPDTPRQRSLAAK